LGCPKLGRNSDFLTVAIDNLLDPSSRLAFVPSIVSTEKPDLQEILLKPDEVNSNRQGE
jgi:hypothetical protein